MKIQIKFFISAALLFVIILFSNSCRKNFSLAEFDNLSTDSLHFEGSFAAPIVDTKLTLINFLPKKDSSLWAEVDENNFEKEVIEKSKEIPVVVDFWATWCMPCLMLGPTLEKFAEDYNGKFILAKLNVDKNPKISQIYNISSIPNVKIFKDGKVADEFVGALPRLMVKNWLDKNLK